MSRVLSGRVMLISLPGMLNVMKVPSGIYHVWQNVEEQKKIKEPAERLERERVKTALYREYARVNFRTVGFQIADSFEEY